MSALLEHLERRRRAGRKLLVPYVLAGLPDAASTGAALAALAPYADALEVGLPYSDPLMDGPVIAAAAERVLARGVGPLDALGLGAPSAPEPGGGAPRLVMTYYNPVFKAGEEAFCRRAARAGYAGLIVPDLPLEESAGLRRAAARAGLAWVPLVTPTSSPARVAALCASATGFVYAVSRLGVTGERRALSERAAAVVAALRAATDLPVLVGIGVSTPEQAVQACAAADGVVVGSAVVRLLSERGIEAAGSFVAGLRAALDGTLAPA